MSSWNLTPQSDPFKTWAAWWAEAKTGAVTPPETVSLATVGADGRPSARIVYFRGLREKGFSFFTNYDSRKGRELGTAPVASMLFHWQHQERQVRVEGKVIPLSARESDLYFYAREPDSQVSACVSKQSAVLASYEQFGREIDAFLSKQGEAPVKRPENWGGYAIIPDLIEFWQAGPHRRHRRIEYQLQPNGQWQGQWLYP